jgi:hypothetical protein
MRPWWPKADVGAVVNDHVANRRVRDVVEAEPLSA